MVCSRRGAADVLLPSDSEKSSVSDFGCWEDKEAAGMLCFRSARVDVRDFLMQSDGVYIHKDGHIRLRLEAVDEGESAKNKNLVAENQAEKATEGQAEEVRRWVAAVKKLLGFSEKDIMKTAEVFFDDYTNNSNKLYGILRKVADTNTWDAEANRQAVRTLHTMKGAATMLKFDDVAAIATDMEANTRANHTGPELLSRFDAIVTAIDKWRTFIAAYDPNHNP